MNSNYLYEYTNLLERIFSTAYDNKYSLKMLEREISHSSFFERVEKQDGYMPIIDESSLIQSIFKDFSIDSSGIPIYNQCLWAAESYLRIQLATKLTFEAIFIYFPIDKMYDYFPIYHEMDFSHLIEQFNSLYNQHSVFELLIEEYGYSLKRISEIVNIPYDTLFSYKKRRRDIKKLSAESAYSLANLFNVRLETLLEIRIQ